MQSKPDEPNLSYFGIQAEWGVTKHFGGRPATDRLAALCGLAPNGSSGKSVLVVGCGAGGPAVHLAQAFGCHVTGVDLSPRMVDWSRQRARKKNVEALTTFRAADARDLPFEDDTFDVVISESVTAFVPAPADALAQYARVIHPGGYVGLNEGTWLSATPDPEFVEFAKRTMDGVNFLPAEGWQALLVGAGLELVSNEVRRIDRRGQRRDEMAGMDLQDWGHLFQAYGRVLQLLATNPRFRAYLRSMIPSRQVMYNLFEHLGYGMYVGRK